MDDYNLHHHVCQWMVVHHQILHCMLFSDEAQFSKDGINNIPNSYMWSVIFLTEPLKAPSNIDSQ
jgi:hypothetical protein